MKVNSIYEQSLSRCETFKGKVVPAFLNSSLKKGDPSEKLKIRGLAMEIIRDTELIFGHYSFMLNITYVKIESQGK